MTISSYVASAAPIDAGPLASSPDSLKDAEALAFLAGQPADVRGVWLERCRLLRWVDQIAESDRWAFGEYVRRWIAVDSMGAHVSERDDLTDWVDATSRAFRRPRMGYTEYAWATWLHALAADYGRSLVPVTLEQHDHMVLEVGGFFRLFPFLSPEHWEAIGAFGALDQAWNNVRDLAEDAEAGRCFFPEQELRRFFGAAPRSPAPQTRAWKSFMTFWLDEHLPTLADRARPFLSATDLHPSVAALRSSCLRRYARVERVLRALEFDYRAFPEAYWAEVRKDVAADALGGGAKEITT